MTQLNPAQRNSVLASARHLDELLVEALRILRESRGEAPFSRHLPDAAPIQVRMVEDSIRRFRGALLRVLDDCGVERPAARTGALHAARVNLLYADVALEDLRPTRMRGYGAVDPEAAAELEGVVAELRALLGQMTELLGDRGAADLAARLEGLPDDTLTLSRVRELERVITARGLVELRPALVRLVERLEAPSLEVGVFGRVSSGKSSLLNRFLGRELLPVGVTPVTALPVRVVYGETPGLAVTAVDGKTAREPLERLAAYATERENPGNAKRVARLAVALPSPRLREGVILVDTPGLGSLATAGAEETRAYLPRCDLGVVLVDAGSILTPEDLALVQALLAAGARTRVLLSKADALAPADRDEVEGYVRRHLREELGTEIEVHAVSVMGPDAGLADAWFETDLEPLLAKHRELAAASLAGKAEALRQATARSLRARLAAGGSERAATAPGAGPPRPGVDGSPHRSPDRSLDRGRDRGGALRRLDAARWQLEDVVRDSASPDAVLAEAADEIGRRWRQERFRPELPAEVLGTRLREETAKVAVTLVGALEELRRALSETLALEGSDPGMEAAEELPRPPAAPLFDPDPVCRGLTLRRPGFATLIPIRQLLASWALSRLEEQAGRGVVEALGFYRRLLVEWIERAIAELRRAFEARAAERGLDSASGGLTGPLSPEERKALEADLRSLEAPSR